jgi:hypothetical protein
MGPRAVERPQAREYSSPNDIGPHSLERKARPGPLTRKLFRTLCVAGNNAMSHAGQNCVLGFLTVSDLRGREGAGEKKRESG